LIKQYCQQNLAPFTTELIVSAFADALKPKQILPVHDGYAKDLFLEQRYKLIASIFKKSGIIFHKISLPGDFIDI
jgi:hypothetical protein